MSLTAADFSIGGAAACTCGKWKLPGRLQLRGGERRDRTIDIDSFRVEALQYFLDITNIKLVMRVHCPECGAVFETINDADALAVLQASPPKAST